MAINWYPGHMTKTRRMIEACLPQIDMIVELVDARIPAASKNPDIARLVKNKPKMLVLNKSDLADASRNKEWLAYYKEQGYFSMLFDSKNRKASSPAFVTGQIKNAFRERTAHNEARGMTGKAIKIMVLGIPNVGKSTFINCMCGTARAKAEDRPGVTRGKQWISLDNGIDMLDMPGILWPKLEDQSAAELLAVTGAIKDNILDTEGLAMKLLHILRDGYENNIRQRYNVTDAFSDDDYELLKQIGAKRGFMLRGGEIDTERTALILIDEFRGAKLGKITLETPPVTQE